MLRGRVLFLGAPFSGWLQTNPRKNPGLHCSRRDLRQEASTSEVVIFLLGAALVMTATAAWPLACLRPRAQRPGWLLLSSSEFSIEVCRRTL